MMPGFKKFVIGLSVFPIVALCFKYNQQFRTTIQILSVRAFFGIEFIKINQASDSRAIYRAPVRALRIGKSGKKMIIIHHGAIDAGSDEAVNITESKKIF